MQNPIEQFDDRAVLRILSQVTTDLREQLPHSEASTIATSSEARAAIASLLEQQAVTSGGSESILADDRWEPAVARQVLELLLTDPETQKATAESIENPPTDSQKSVELAISGAVVLGALIAWLQTSVEIEIHRTDGKLDFKFNVKKGPTNGQTLADIAKIVAGLIP
ncbi:MULTISPECIES: hypothetical protein [unclassified Burkholderia]|uniref:hypothetical protein n=1 Tax=unclassified Burkholderia TaxID=2613784 RepID=UPI001423D3D1|nr:MULTISPECIES: hypothetical protein [unclassified Burkholderia]NIE59624.1 hypothetical protein [Burkholderia sp. Ap-955]NIF11713.1 hypothetical protein [Burkholderia sp. Ax-1735]NIG04560.1 hypothetical protein [Burkholderia sp. Tr-849]